MVSLLGRCFKALGSGRRVGGARMRGGFGDVLTLSRLRIFGVRGRSGHCVWGVFYLLFWLGGFLWGSDGSRAWGLWGGGARCGLTSEVEIARW